MTAVLRATLTAGARARPRVRRITDWEVPVTSARFAGRRTLLRLSVLIGCVGAAVGITLGPGSASALGTHSAGGSSNHYVVGLFGDMPYGDAAKAQYPNLLADLNAHDLAFSAFDGDLKAGGDGACSNDLYARQLSASTRCARL